MKANVSWITAQVQLYDHPKLRRLAKALGTSRAEALGHLMFLWFWCVKHAQDGDLSEYHPDEIAEAVDWPNDPDELLAALVDAGWLDDNPMRVHDWWDHAGESVKRYTLSYEGGVYGRHVQHHVNKGVSSDSCPHCVGGASGGPTRGATGTEHNRTGHNKT